jgi:tetratricopeptide (TPR) repeat protein/peroxiredoxin
VALANPYLARNDHASAIRCYDKAISIDSTFEFGYDALIAVYNETKRTQEADRIAGLLVRKCPHSIPAILIQLAKARGEKDHERKIEMCRELIRTSPHSPATPYVYTELLIAVEWKGLDSLDVLARSVLQLPMPEFGKPRQFASIKLFSIAKTQGASTLNALAGELYQTKDPHVLRTIGKYYLDTLDNPDKALQFLAKAYDVCSKENAYNTLVAGLCTDKLLEESASNYQAVISYNSGMAYAKRGEYPRAIECLLGAAPRAEAANIVDVYFHLGSLYIKRDQNDEAVKWLTKGLALKSDANARKQLIGLVGSEVRAEEAIEQERNGNTQHPIDFRLCSLKGDTVQLSSYRKKVVVVSFWATWCLPCIKEMPHIQKLATEYGENPDVVFLCISRDHSRDSSRQFLTRNKYSMEMLFDDDAQPSLGVGSIPTLLLVDREGRVQFRHVGFDGNGAELVGMLRREITEVIARH